MFLCNDGAPARRIDQEEVKGHLKGSRLLILERSKVTLYLCIHEIKGECFPKPIFLFII